MNGFNAIFSNFSPIQARMRSGPILKLRKPVGVGVAKIETKLHYDTFCEPEALTSQRQVRKRGGIETTHKRVVATEVHKIRPNMWNSKYLRNQL